MPPAPDARVESRSRDLSRPLPAAVSWTVLGVFAAALTATTLAGASPWWIAAAYGAMSAIAFAAFGIDKAIAGGSARRVPEKTLLALSVLCGWPGAIVAQQLFRHKTRKRSFRRPFWGAVVMNVLAWAALVAVGGANGWWLTG